MPTQLLKNDLTLPEALMAFLHNSNGQPIQSARPPALSAAAELGELVLRDHVHLEDDLITAVTPAGSGERKWIDEILSGLQAEPAKVRTWIRKRRTALKTQQAEAIDHGVLDKGRGKLFGLFGYSRLVPDPTIRQSLLEELEATDASSVPRAQALAQLLLSPQLQRHLRFDDARVERLTDLATDEDGTPLPGPLFTTMDIALASGIAVGVLGE